MEKTDEQLHYESMHRFVELANTLTKDGMPNRVVAAGLMTASCVYTTFMEVGNQGTLDEAGIDRITDGYRKHLIFTQESREENARTSAEEKAGETQDETVITPEDS